MMNNILGGRRHDIDALRVFSFGTVIIYHTSLLFGTRDWLLNSYESSRLMDLIAIGSHPWRMSLLFFISGLVTASLLNRKSVEEICRSRTRHLLLPFLFGVVFIVPPQIYFAALVEIPGMSYWDFLKAYVANGIMVEHLWFLLYLWVYVCLWSLAMPRLTKRLPNLPSAFASSLKGAGLFLLPVAFLAALRVFLYPVFGESLNVINDVYAHALYFSMFMAGSLLVNQPQFWSEIDRQRWVSLGLAAASLLAIVTIALVLPREQRPDVLVVLMRIIRSVFQWCSIITLLAFAGRIASRPSRVVAYLNKSMMTYYVVHQTVIIIAAYCFIQADRLDPGDFLPILIITLLVCALAAEAKKFAEARVVPWLSKLVAPRKPREEPSSLEAAG